MNTESIYQYQSAREFLKDSIASRRQGDSQFSIRKFCKQSDFGSHAYLVMILKGKRALCKLWLNDINPKREHRMIEVEQYHLIADWVHMAILTSELALDSLEEQDPSIREFQSFAMTVPKGKIPLAKQLIRKFRHQLVQLMEAEPGHEVYQCNLQFFKLAESPFVTKPSAKT